MRLGVWTLMFMSIITLALMGGVVIPARNRKNLMLRDDVIQSVERGDFHIFSVNTVDEALEALTGIPAGERGPDGAFPEDPVHGRVDKRLREMGEAMRHFGRRPPDDNQAEKADGAGPAAGPEPGEEGEPA